MVKKIIIVRHGETPGNSEGRFQIEEISLSEKGNEQAKLLGKRLKDEYGSKVKKIIASDLKRARETALHIFDALYDIEGLVLETHPILQERNFGDLRGQLYKDVLAKVNLLEPDYRPSNGESVNDFNQRIAKVYDFIKYHAKNTISDGGVDSDDDVIVIVTHGLVKTHLAKNHFDHGDKGFPPNNAKQLMFHNTSMTIIELNESEEKANVKLLNCIDHLPSDLRIDEEKEKEKFRPTRNSKQSEDVAYDVEKSKL